MLAEFKGLNGKIKVFDDHIILSRDTFGGFMAQGHSGDRKLFYTDITAVDYKRPSLIANGYYKFTVPGSTDTNAKVGLFGSSHKSMKDPNTIGLRAFTSKVGDETDRIYKLIMDKVTEAKNKQRAAASVTISNTPSKMDELKKLAELKEAAIITEEEFQIEKQKLLNKDS